MKRAAVLAVLISVSLTGPGLAQGPAALSPQEVVERAGDAVVLIEADGVEGESQGSGFLVGGDGTIVTCLHVIDGARSLAVSLRDGTRLEEVTVQAFDVELDLAVLLLDLRGVDDEPTTVELGDTRSIEPGARIVVIGNPLGLEHTVTEGIVSAWREPDEEAETPLGMPPVRLLQISATISPGSSGGPVFNDRAEVVGVATSGVMWGMAGLNFALPVDALPALLEQDGAMDLETFAERVDDLRREKARPHFQDGRLAYERGDYEEAVKRLERALQLFPRHEEALLLSGEIMMMAGQIDVAEQRFTLAVEIDEYNADAWYHLGVLHQAKAAESGGTVDLARAESTLERALEIDERHGRAAFRLALIQFAKGDLDRAEQLLVTATENEPGFADAYYTLGEVHLRRGRTNEAKDAFEQALWEDENHARGHFGMARLYMELERTPQGGVAQHGRASHHWEEFLRLSEDDPALAEQREAAIFYIKRHFPQLLD